MDFSNFLSKKEWKELKKFENLPISERSIVFYAENKASINHFRLLINELTEVMNLQICYVTSVKDDPMLDSKNQNIKSFFIGDGVVRTKFFVTLKAKILLMDMPDIEKFHIKRSRVYSVHYIYIFHSMFSVHSYLREGAIDNYDTIFCVGKHHFEEIREIEKIYNLKQKELVPYGFGRLDTLLKEKNDLKNLDSSKKIILIVPSYGENNLLEICGIKLIELLLRLDFKVILRPHFRIFKDSQKLMESIKKKFNEEPNFVLEEGIIPSELFHNSTSMISDWSGISLEYAFALERPIFFIDVPKKTLNENHDIIQHIPIEVSLRDKIGYVISPKDLESIPKILELIKESDDLTKQKIKEIRSKTVFNIGESAKIGAKYIKNLLEELEKK